MFNNVNILAFATSIESGPLLRYDLGFISATLDLGPLLILADDLFSEDLLPSVADSASLEKSNLDCNF